MSSEHDHDTLLIETIARHFDGARIDGNEIDLGVAGLHIACQVHGVREYGVTTSASLFFHLWGGKLGDAPIFASMSGYGASAVEAIVTGGCNWACVFGAVLEAALAGKPIETGERFDVNIDGRAYTAVVDGMSRVLSYGEAEDADTNETAQAAYKHLGANPWLATKVLASGTLPALPRERATVLSVFCWEAANQRTLEVKVNGADWLPATRIFDETPRTQRPHAALLRELVVLVPKDEPLSLSRDLVAKTLDGAATSEPTDLRSWPGWAAHGGRLGSPLSDLELARLEAAIGPLPPDYREFLREVQAAGAGPGYGLISPASAVQQRMAVGTFAWQDGEEPHTPPAGALALAHAGCGVMWLLVTTGPCRGEVWVDAGGSDRRARRVAPSFSAWFHDWLDALVRSNGSFSHWDGQCCATPSVVSQVLDALEAEGFTSDRAVAELPRRMSPGALKLSSADSFYFDAGDALDPCESCTGMMTRLGIGHDVFGPGVLPRHARVS